MTEYLILGSGIAGRRAADAIREHDADGEITIIDEQANPFYARTMLVELLAKGLGADKIPAKEKNRLAESGIKLELGTRIKELRARDQRVLLDDGRLKIFPDVRKKLQPDPVPEETPVKIALICTECNLSLFEVSLDFFPFNLKERPDQSLIHHRINTGQSAESASPHQPHEKSFGLVGQGVTRGDSGSAGFRCFLVQEFIPELSSGLLDVLFRGLCSGPNISPANKKRQGEFPGRIPDKPFIFLSALAKLVVEVTQEKLQRPFFLKLEKKTEESRGIDSPGISDENLILFIEEPIILDSLFDFFEKHSRWLRF